MFVHIVLFWLKDDAPADERQRLVDDCELLLRKIPSVRQIHAGRPAMTPREIVDNSYDVGLCVVLEDSAGHDEYQKHELHQQFIERHRPHWQRVQVYDFH